MQSWGDIVVTNDCYQDEIRRIEKQQMGKGDHAEPQQPPSTPVIRVIKRIVVRTKAAAT